MFLDVFCVRKRFRMVRIAQDAFLSHKLKNAQKACYFLQFLRFLTVENRVLALTLDAILCGISKSTRNQLF